MRLTGMFYFIFYELALNRFMIFLLFCSIKISISRVETNVLNKEVVVFDGDTRDYHDTMDYRVLWPEQSNCVATLSPVDKPSGVLRVCCNLIENLSFTCIVAVDQYQSPAIDMLFVILRDIVSVPGKVPSFFLIRNRTRRNTT